MTKQKIIGTGLSGMVGSKVVELLSDRYEFEDLSLEKGVDIRDKKKVKERIGQSKAKVVLHLAAKTDVDGCEKDLPLKEKGVAWQVNVLGTKNIADACRVFNKKIIYISTDFVFDGSNPPVGGYTEKDSPSPVNWYGQTKYEGEKIAQKLKTSLILRIAFPFRASFPQKKDLVRLVLEKLEKREKIKAVSDQIITPTFIDDIACGLEVLIKKKATGVYHLVGSQFLSPFKMISLIASQFSFDSKFVSCVKMEDYYQDRAPRPKNLALKNEKAKKSGIKMRTFKEGLKETKRQIEVLASRL